MIVTIDKNNRITGKITIFPKSEERNRVYDNAIIVDDSTIIEDYDLYEIINGVPSLIDGWETIKAQREADKVKQELELNKATKIKEAYDKYLSTRYSDIAYMNTTFQADANSQALIVSVLSAGSVPDGFFWLDVNNAQISMTYADLQGLSGAILARGQQAYADYQAKKAEILATTTVADLDAVVI